MKKTSTSETANHWFSGCDTLETLKAKYRELAKQYHPDLGGDTVTMQEINAEYDQRRLILESLDSSNDYSQPDNSELYRDPFIQKVFYQTSVFLQDFGDFDMIYQDGRLTVSGPASYHARESLKSSGWWWDSERRYWWYKGKQTYNRRYSSRGNRRSKARG